MRGYEFLSTPDMTTVTEALSKNMKMPSAWLLFKMGVLRLAPSPEEIFGFFFWIKHCAESPDFTPQGAVEMSFRLSDYKPSAKVMQGYAAPFPEGSDKERFIAG